MSVNYEESNGTIDYSLVHDLEGHSKIAKQIAVLALQASHITARFANVERIPRYPNGERENDVEHSYMLALIAPDIARTLGLQLDTEKIMGFALCHDLLEMKVGDIATFNLSPEELEEKAKREQLAKDELIRELPPHIAHYFEVYEAQRAPEAVFVRMVDKLLPVAVDITGDGVRIMHEDYGITTTEALVHAHDELEARLAKKFGEDFPELIDAHRVLSATFARTFRQDRETYSSQEVPRSPIETELKYLIHLDTLPEDIDLRHTQKSQIRQGYITIGTDGSETRIRSFDDERFELTNKTPGLVQRGEQTVTINRDTFDALWPQTEGSRIEKTRHYLPYGDHTIELDIYEGLLLGLATAEVEFRGRPGDAAVKAASFTPPEWFGNNISEDYRYKNHTLARQLPHDPLPIGKETY